MSKLERLNARVAKLLTEAVQEVLDVVKETVSEYQQKTARTQRENESLKRRLQELQDRLPEESTDLPASEPFPEEEDNTEHHDQDFNLIQRPNQDFTFTDHGLKQEFKEQENHSETQSQAEHCKVQPKVVTHISETALTSQTSHSTLGDTSGVSSNDVCSSHSSSPLGVHLVDIKRETEPTECTVLGKASTEEKYFGCMDLSSGSSRQNTSEPHKEQVSGETYGLAFVHSHHTHLHRRQGSTKAGRVAFEGRKLRTDPLGKGDLYLCVVCGKTFSRVGNLKIHQRCHTGEKPYGCVQCGRRFTQAGDLKKHKRVHTGEKPYYCLQCGKSFSRGENLKRHQRIHIGQTLQLQKAWREQK
ncbi:zinc finger and SCAN domain-containing protein 2-like isoform X2 [Cololabis saira]|uniref:zinc finger and SCAN domain-containing protein 2-like isoform X2 n=1 Tax=Cololabis saira TaxID=129043 RepID=UPI002AD3E358|nr:zinc finger and SCAN domain-containing protein 2-like isoform X2 [Cololabis saira]